MIALTGATGHLGTVILDQLSKQGEQLRCISRSKPSGELKSRASEWLIGDLSDPTIVNNLVAGAETVIHSAALISILPGNWDALYRVNVLGTRALLEAAQAAGVRRFVYVGSIESFPLEDRVRPVSEAQGIHPDRTAIEYGHSKALAVQEVLGWSGRMECVVCSPTSFIGPPDYRRSPIGQVIFDYLNRGLPAYVTGGFDFVDVRDVADGVIRAAKIGRPGQVYLLSGRYATIPELMDMLEDSSGIPKPRLCLPHWIIRPFTPAIELYYRLTRRPPQFTNSSLKLLRLNVTVDSLRAREELGFRPRPLEETIADTVEWFRQTSVPPAG